jgi:hypothetical protein
LRDDVKKFIAELTQRYSEKLKYVKKLLLNESDKLHYLKSQNIDRIFELIESDKDIIEEIDAIDYDISHIETDLSNIMGLNSKDIFTHLVAEKEEVTEVVSLRNEIRNAIKLLYKQRELLTDSLMSESRHLQKSIDEISRIGRLKIP